MKKLALMVLFLLIVLATSVYSTDLTITGMSPASLSGEPGETLFFTIMLSGAVELPGDTVLDVGFVGSPEPDIDLSAALDYTSIYFFRDVWTGFHLTIPEDAVP